MRMLVVLLTCLVGAAAGTVQSAAMAGTFDRGSDQESCLTVNAAGADWAGRDLHGPALIHLFQNGGS